MTNTNNSSLYNGQNLVFTGNKNPYGLIQSAGKRKTRKRRIWKNRKLRGMKKQGIIENKNLYMHIRSHSHTKNYICCVLKES
jgi:hypothetical protein